MADSRARLLIFYRVMALHGSRCTAILSGINLKVVGLPGYVMLAGGSRSRCQEIPFEDVIFEEAGFLPADTGNVITVKATVMWRSAFRLILMCCHCKVRQKAGRRSVMWVLSRDHGYEYVSAGNRCATASGV